MHVVYEMIYSWMAVNSIMCRLFVCHRVDRGITQGISTQREMELKRFSIGWSDTWPEVSCWKQVCVLMLLCRCLFFPRKDLLCDLINISLLPPDFDPNLGMMAGITPLNPMMPGLGMVPAPLSQDVPVIKEIIHCKSCTLFPPNPSKP